MIWRGLNLFVYLLRFKPLIPPGEADKDNKMIVKYQRFLIDKDQ
jgi:hypothetical protein